MRVFFAIWTTTFFECNLGLTWAFIFHLFSEFLRPREASKRPGSWLSCPIGPHGDGGRPAWAEVLMYPLQRRSCRIMVLARLGGWLEGITRMYLWWVVTAAPLLWDTVRLKSKILHSLVLVGPAVVLPCRRLWCMVFDRDYSIFPTVLQSKAWDNSDGYKIRDCLVAVFLFSGGIGCSSMSQNELGVLDWKYPEACCREHADFFIRHKGGLMRNDTNSR